MKTRNDEENCKNKLLVHKELSWVFISSKIKRNCSVVNMTSSEQ